MADPSPPEAAEPAAEVQDVAEIESSAVDQQMQQMQQQQQMSQQMQQQQLLIQQHQLQEGQMAMGLGAMPPMPFHIKPGQPVPQYLPMGGPPMGMPMGMMPPGMQQMMPGMQMPPQGLYFPPPDARAMGKQGQFPPWAMGGPVGPDFLPKQYRNYTKGGGGDRGGGGGRNGDGGGRNGDGNGNGGGGSSGRRRDTGALSKTNIYISGLKSTTTDEDLRALCQSYGTIVSAKAIIDRDLNQCKGYGFVMFEKESSAKAAVDALLRSGAQAAFAKVTRAQVEWQGRQEADPTNLYLTNLPKDQDESALSAMLLNCLEQQVKGEIVSCRVLRDAQGLSRGVGLARMDCREACEVIIKRLNGCVLPGCVDPLRVKFANSPSPRKFKFLQRTGGRMQPNAAAGGMYDPSVAEMGFPAAGPGVGLEIGMQGMHIDPAMLAAQRTQAMMMAQIQPTLGQTPQVWGLGEGGPDGTLPASAGTGAVAEGAAPPAEGPASTPAAAPAVAPATMAAMVAGAASDGDESGGGDASVASSAQENAKRMANNKFMQGSMVNTAATSAYEQYLQTSTNTAKGVALGVLGPEGGKP